MILFNIFNVNPTIVTKKAPKHLLNATEVVTCINGVEAYHIRMLNGLTSYSGQIFRENLLFFKTGLC